MDSGFILKVVLIGFTDRLDMVYVRERGYVQNDVGSNWVMKTAG